MRAISAQAPADARADLSALATDGLFSGIIGAFTVAIFFLILDIVDGRPLFTPSLLGSVVFLGANAESVNTVSLPMAAVYTGLHFGAFFCIGVVAAYMVDRFEHNPPVGAVLILLAVCFEAAFFAFTIALAPGVVGVLGAWAVGVANLLAAATMAVYFRLSHPHALEQLDRIWEE
jgi:hypothetical protein